MRVFASEPLLPSEIEAMEERQLLQGTHEAVEDSKLVALIVPTPPTRDPESAPESLESLDKLPSLQEVSEMLWHPTAAEEEEQEAALVNGDHIQNKARGYRLCFRIQNLEAQPYEDDEWELEQQDSEQDIQQPRVQSAQAASFPEQETARAGSRAGSGHAVRMEAWATPRGTASSAGQRHKMHSLLCRVKAAVRDMDRVLPEVEVEKAAVSVIKEATRTFLQSEGVILKSARQATWGMGDRVRLEGLPGGSERGMRSVTVHLGMRRWGKQNYGPGFAVETQQVLRVGLKTPSKDSVPHVGANCSKGGETSGRGQEWQRRLWGVRGKVSEGLQEGAASSLEVWVGTIACNHCQGYHWVDRRARSETETDEKDLDGFSLARTDYPPDKSSNGPGSRTWEQKACCGGHTCLRFKPLLNTSKSTSEAPAGLNRTQ
ncbi:unnamed protein product, partial [Discosporangium mesarthrocarpum]